MIDSIRTRLSAWLIENSIKIMPKHRQNRRFINNLMITGHIKVENDLNRIE